jgi:predicted RNase H-like HicB family nuclease
VLTLITRRHAQTGTIRAVEVYLRDVDKVEAFVAHGRSLAEAKQRAEDILRRALVALPRLEEDREPPEPEEWR